MKLTLVSPPFGENILESKGVLSVTIIPVMTPEYRENAIKWLRAEMFSNKRIAKRLWGLKWKGFPMVHFSSFMIQYPMGRSFREIDRDDPYATTK